MKLLRFTDPAKLKAREAPAATETALMLPVLLQICRGEDFTATLRVGSQQLEQDCEAREDI